MINFNISKQIKLPKNIYNIHGCFEQYFLPEYNDFRKKKNALERTFFSVPSVMEIQRTQIMFCIVTVVAQ